MYEIVVNTSRSLKRSIGISSNRRNIALRSTRTLDFRTWGEYNEAPEMFPKGSFHLSWMFYMYVRTCNNDVFARPRFYVDIGLKRFLAFAPWCLKCFVSPNVSYATSWPCKPPVLLVWCMSPPGERYGRRVVHIIVVQNLKYMHSEYNLSITTFSRSRLIR